MFRTRLLSGIVLVLAVFLVISQGGILLYGVLALVSLIGMREFYKAMQVSQVSENGMGILELAGYVGALLYEAALWSGIQKFGLAAVLAALALLMSVYVFTYPKYQAGQVMAAFFGVVYLTVMLSSIYLTRQLEGGFYHVWLIFLCSWGCDTCAYCVGVLFGKHKMAPVLSPKKSVEGAVGGVAGAALLGVLYAYLTKGGMAGYALICAVGALWSMVGDLAASAVKRQTGIKDYGKLIPGHGGILDRFDSVIFTAPVIYFLVVWMA